MFGDFPKKDWHRSGRVSLALVCAAVLYPWFSHAAETNDLTGTFQPVAPAGSRVYSRSLSNSIIEGIDSDVYLAGLDSGQTVSIALMPDAGLRPELFVGNTLGVVTTLPAAAAGEELLLQDFPVDLAGTYVVGVSGLHASSGSYELELALNAAFEHEGRSGSPNNDSEFAQPATPIALEGGAGGNRATILGALEGEVDLTVASESWDTTTFGPDWTTYSSDFEGRFFIVGIYGFQDAPRALWMDRAPTGAFTLNEAIWEVDLSQVAQPELRFFQAERNDEEHSFQTAGVEFVPFIDHYNADGVAISDNGTNWQPVYTPTHQPDSVWVEQRIDLADRAADAGMTLTSNFLDFSIPADGRGYDAISVVTLGPDEDWYAMDFSAGDRATLVLESLTGGPIGVELIAPDGLTPLATGTVASASRRIIHEHPITTGSTHYARVAGTNGVYGLTMLRDVSWGPRQQPVGAGGADHRGHPAGDRLLQCRRTHRRALHLFRGDHGCTSRACDCARGGSLRLHQRARSSD